MPINPDRPDRLDAPGLEVTREGHPQNDTQRDEPDAHMQAVETGQGEKVGREQARVDANPMT